MISITNHGAVRELQLNRPPVNALNLELVAALRQAVKAAPEDGVLALVLSGAPGRFSAGLDVPLLLGLDRPAMAALWREFYGLLKALAGSPIPIVAAITGHAPAGGTVLPLFCDWRVGAEGEFKLGAERGASRNYSASDGSGSPAATNRSAPSRAAGSYRSADLAAGSLEGRLAG